MIAEGMVFPCNTISLTLFAFSSTKIMFFKQTLYGWGEVIFSEL